MTDQAAASTEAKPTDRGPLSVQQAVELTLSRMQTAPAAPAPEPAEATAPSEANPEQVEPQEAVVEGVEPEAEDAKDEPTEEATEADDGEGIVLDDTSKIVLPDGSEWTAKELVEGTMRLKDYTKKTMQAAEARKAAETLAKEVQDKAAQLDTEYAAQIAAMQEATKATTAERERYAAQVAKIVEAQKGHLAKWESVDWDRLQQEDPVRASQLWMQKERDREAHAVLEREQRDLEAKAKADTDAAQKAAEENAGKSWAQQREALADHVKANHPTLVDPEKGNAEWAAMATTMKAAGLPDDVILAAVGQRRDPNVPVMSAPIFELVRKATLYDQAQAQHSKALASPGAPKANADGKIRVVKSDAPRFRPPPAEKAALGRAKAAFNQNPSFENAKKLELAKIQSR